MALTMLRPAGRALRRSAPRVFAEEERFLRRNPSRPLMDNPRRLFSSDCAGSAQANKQRLHSNLSELEQKKIILEEERAFHQRLSSYVNKLSRSLDDQSRLIDELEVQMQNSKQYDQIKQLLLVLVIPSSVFVGIVLNKMHMVG